MTPEIGIDSMETAREVDWQEIDALLYSEAIIPAIKRYREMNGCGINRSLEELLERKSLLRKQFPERFKTQEQLDAEAYEQAQTRLGDIQAKIVVIEGSWDADSLGWFIILSAITEEPSSRHPRYRDLALCLVKGGDIIEKATIWGTEFARRAGAGFVLIDEQDWDVRWWDTQ